MAFTFKSHGVTHVFESEDEARRQGWRSSPGKAGDTWSKVGSDKPVSPQLAKATPEEVKASLKGIIGPGSADLSLLPKPIIPVATQTVNNFVAAAPSPANVTVPKAKAPKKKVNRLPHGDPFAKPNKIGKPVSLLPLMPEEELHKYALKLLVEDQKERLISAHIQKGPFPLPEENILQRMAETQSDEFEKSLMEKSYKNNPKGYLTDLLKHTEERIIHKQYYGEELPRISMDAFYQRLTREQERAYKTTLKAGMVADEVRVKADLGILFQADKDQKLAAHAKNRIDLNILYDADKEQKLGAHAKNRQDLNDLYQADKKQKLQAHAKNRQDLNALKEADKQQKIIDKKIQAVISQGSSEVGETIIPSRLAPAAEQAEEVVRKAPISKRTMEKMMSSNMLAAGVAAGGLGLLYASNKMRGEREVGR
jgi:hypothetical protein